MTSPILGWPVRAREGVVRKSRFSEDQIIAILNESEAGLETRELCRRRGSRALYLRLEEPFGRIQFERSEMAAAVGRRTTVIQVPTVKWSATMSLT